MTWTAEQQRDVGTALLGSWPATMTAWGKEAIAAYIGELRARGLTAEQVLTAIRTWPAGSDFPPSAPNLAAAARKDPSKPTFDEALELWRHALRAWNLPLTGNYGSEAEMAKLRKQRVLDRAAGMHPLVASFVDRHGVYRLQDEVGELDGQYGAIRRQELEAAWQEHCDAFDGRETAALASGRRGEMGRLDPLSALGISAPAGQLEEGNGL